MLVEKWTEWGLKIWENKEGDVFVEGLSWLPVHNYDEIEWQIAFGTTNRTIGATKMNETSSRAHTVTTISFKQTYYDKLGKPLN